MIKNLQTLAKLLEENGKINEYKTSNLCGTDTEKLKDWPNQKVDWYKTFKFLWDW